MEVVALKYLNVQCSALYLRCALAYEEGDAVRAVVCRLCEVNAEEVKPSVQLLVSTLDGQGLQALLMAGQRTLRTR